MAPRFREFDSAADGDPLEFVVVTNLHRRHLTPSQCAMVGADLATMRQGARTDLRQPSASLPEVSQAQASRLATASERGVRSAVFVKKKGSPDLVQAVRAGKIAVSLAAKLATASEAIQRQAVAEPERAHVLVKQERRDEREAELAAKQLALPDEDARRDLCRPAVAIRGLLARHRLDRDACNHYPTMASRGSRPSTSRPSPRPIPCCSCGRQCRMLPQALEVMKAWGFEYRSAIRLGEGPRRDRLLDSQSARALLVGTAATSPRPRRARSGRA